MLMHTPAPVPLFPFTPSERAAALWAMSCAHLLLKRGEQDGDPAAPLLRDRVPGLRAATIALNAGALDAQDVHALAVVLGGLCQARDHMPAEVWTALRPPPSPVLDAARAKAARLGGAGSVQA